METNANGSISSGDDESMRNKEKNSDPLNSEIVSESTLHQSNDPTASRLSSRFSDATTTVASRSSTAFLDLTLEGNNPAPRNSARIPGHTSTRSHPRKSGFVHLATADSPSKVAQMSRRRSKTTFISNSQDQRTVRFDEITGGLLPSPPPKSYPGTSPAPYVADPFHSQPAFTSMSKRSRRVASDGHDLRVVKESPVNGDSMGSQRQKLTTTNDSPRSDGPSNHNPLLKRHRHGLPIINSVPLVQDERLHSSVAENSGFGSVSGGRTSVLTGSPAYDSAARGQLVPDLTDKVALYGSPSSRSDRKATSHMTASVTRRDDSRGLIKRNEHYHRSPLATHRVGTHSALPISVPKSNSAASIPDLPRTTNGATQNLNEDIESRESQKSNVSSPKTRTPSRKTKSWLNTIMDPPTKIEVNSLLSEKPSTQLPARDNVPTPKPKIRAISQQTLPYQVNSVEEDQNAILKPSPVPAKPPKSLEHYQGCLKETFAGIRNDHAYLVKCRLAQARKRQTEVNMKQQVAASRDTNPSFFTRWTQKDSPFSGLKNLLLDSRTSGKTKVMKLGQHFLKGGRADESLRSYGYTPYLDKSVSIPPYTNYISTKRNLLTEDDKFPTFLPVLEDVKLDLEYLTAENMRKENQERYHRSNALTELVHHYAPYADDFLNLLGCDVLSVLKYLMTDVDVSPPQQLPAELRQIWRVRGKHLPDDYYRSYDNETDELEPQKEWQALDASLSRVISGPKLAAATLACEAFFKETGFSLWHVAVQAFRSATERKGAAKSKSHRIHFNKSSSPDPYSLSTYSTLGCLICKGHECPGHGEYEDEDDEENLRTRVTHKEYSPPLMELSPIEDRNHGSQDDLMSRMGLNKDETVSGKHWMPNEMLDNDDGLEPTELCSDNCFWPKSNRSATNRLNRADQWSPEQLKILETLRPAYEGSSRAPCLLFGTGVLGKSCFQIFRRLLRADSLSSSRVSLKSYNMVRAGNAKISTGRRKPMDYWLDNYKETYLHHEREPFTPCNHPGPCDAKANCDCFINNVTCEKTCACNDECRRKFSGCQCAAKSKSCGDNDSCECSRLNRECDPDLCRTCGAHQVLDPVNRHDPRVLQGKCTNVSIQRGVPKRTLLGPSKLMADGGRSGWGLYMGESCRKGAYVGEYVGEVVSQEESDQRGVIYDKRNLSYLFNVNKSQTLDSTLIGNKLRFINHQDDAYTNIRPKTMFCNSVQRIGMFASREIAIGEELFFNYGKEFVDKFNLIKKNPKGGVCFEETKRSLPIKSTRKAPKAMNITKTGHRIGRPQKSEEYTYLNNIGKASKRKPPKQKSSSSMDKSLLSDSPERRSRKRRHSEFMPSGGSDASGLGKVNGSPEKSDMEVDDSEVDPEVDSSVHTIQSISSDNNNNNNDNDESDNASGDQSDESSFHTDDARPTRQRTRRQALRSPTPEAATMGARKMTRRKRRSSRKRRRWTEGIDSAEDEEPTEVKEAAERRSLR